MVLRYLNSVKLTEVFDLNFVDLLVPSINDSQFIKKYNYRLVTDFVFKKGSIEKSYIKHLKMMKKSTLIFHYVNVFHGRVDTLISVQTIHTGKFIIS